MGRGKSKQSEFGIHLWFFRESVHRKSTDGAGGGPKILNITDIATVKIEFFLGLFAYGQGFMNHGL